MKQLVLWKFDSLNSVWAASFFTSFVPGRTTDSSGIGAAFSGSWWSKSAEPECSDCQEGGCVRSAIRSAFIETGEMDLVERVHGVSSAHWDHEPRRLLTRAALFRLPQSRDRQGAMRWFMESRHDLATAHSNREVGSADFSPLPLGREKVKRTEVRAPRAARPLSEIRSTRLGGDASPYRHGSFQTGPQMRAWSGRGAISLHISFSSEKGRAWAVNLCVRQNPPMFLEKARPWRLPAWPTNTNK
jgi:hypothetical protein